MNKIRKLFLIFPACLFVFSIYAQDSYIKNRWNYKVAYSRIVTVPTSNVNKENREVTIGNYHFETNFGISNKLEIGGYVGYSRFKMYSSSILTYSNSPFYGINANLHILPFFIEKNDFRFDLYLSSKLGGHYLFLFDEKFYSINKNKFDYKIGCGFSFYLWKHLGFFTEFGYANYSNLSLKDLTRFGYNNLTNLSYGLTFKF